MKQLLIIASTIILLTGCAHSDKQILTKEKTTARTDGYTQVTIPSSDETILNTQPMTESKEFGNVITVVMKTSMGDITLELFADKAPKTVANFITLAQKDFYDGILFHRVIPDFMIQAGDPNTKTEPKKWEIHGTGGPGYKFDDEFNTVPLVQGSLAMANAGPNTNGSQFFIVTADATPWLDGRHTNFGRVVDGMDVVLAIQNVEANGNDHPLKDVVIEDIEVVKE